MFKVGDRVSCGGWPGTVIRLSTYNGKPAYSVEFDEKGLIGLSLEDELQLVENGIQRAIKCLK